MVTSDGTHSERSIALLEAIDPVVKVESARSDFPPDLSPAARAFLSEHATGKQLALIMSLPRGTPALYIDSDVLFFLGATELARMQPTLGVPARYLGDCRLSADERLFRDPSEKESPINTGVLFLGGPLDWSESVARFDALEGAPDFFTNQTMTHLTMHACGALPLDPAKYILQLDDQFIYADRHVRRETVLRHYVRPVRHKFWTTLANSRSSR
ncbi:MAG: hypothetical protein M3Z64_08435 [Verrucomicrobiota bacterium]|nr:hypothetical protein [Verrucomicrobiota bacterium]